jgi:hypothetical protein
MSIVQTYGSTITSTKTIFEKNSGDLTQKIETLEKNITDLNGLSARSYNEIKDQLKVLNQQMLTYYSEELPKIPAVRDAALKAIATIKTNYFFLQELGTLSKKNIEHLVRLGMNNSDLLTNREIELKKGQSALEGYITTLNNSILKIDSLEKPFMAALNSALKAQEVGEGTAGFLDAAWSLASYAYLNKALAAKAAVVDAVQPNA